MPAASPSRLRVLSSGSLTPDLLASFGPSGGTIVVDGPVRLAHGTLDPATGRGRIDIPGMVVVEVAAGGRIDLAGNDLVFRSRLRAVDAYVFANATGLARVRFEPAACQDSVCADWWIPGAATPTACRQGIAAAFASLAIPLEGPGQGLPSGTVRLTARAYVLDAGLDVPAHAGLHGMGRTVTFLTLAGPASPGSALLRPQGVPAAFRVGEPGTFRVGDLTLTGPGPAVLPSDPGASCGIALRDEVRLRFERVRVEGFDIGVRATATEGVDIDACEFRGNRYGIVLDGVDGARVSHSVFSLSTWGGGGVVVGATGGTAAGRCIGVRVQACRFTGDGAGKVQAGVRVLCGRLVGVRDCRFSKLDVGVSFGKGSLDGIGGEVGWCRFTDCARAVDPGDVSARVKVWQRGGSATAAFMATNPPDEACWQAGDRIVNSAPAPGEPYGWACSGPDAATGKPAWWVFARFEEKP